MKIMSNKKLRKACSFRVQVPKTYIWDVLYALVKDLEDLLTENQKRDIYGIIRRRDFRDYLKFSEAWSLQSINSSDMQLHESAAVYQIGSLLKKYPYDIGLDREQQAFNKFFESEDSCRSFNHCGYKRLYFSDDKFILGVFANAKNFISGLIGDCLPCFEEATRHSRHGPGASLGTHNGLISKYYKYSDWPYTCTELCSSLALSAIYHDERWRGSLEDSYRNRNSIPKTFILNQEIYRSSILSLVDGNKVITVPKNSLINRTIAIEPLMNLYLQLGVDGFIRERLKRYGIDLSTQLKNQKLARLGSKTGSHCTIDLSAASDSIALRLCQLLLPKQWYTYLCLLRSPSGILGNESIRYEKISSMGNGYTFVLETLIFAAITHSVVALSKDILPIDFSFFNDVAVYGDDIVVPSAVYNRLTKALNAFGFKINTEKSFSSGICRESCGTDWFAGINIRPVFIKESPVTVKSLFLDFNRFQRYGNILFGRRLNNVQSYIYKHIPQQWRCITGPYSDEVFDTYLHHDHGSQYANGAWSFRSIIYVDNAQRANDFGFRKLMCDLSPDLPLYDPYTDHNQSNNFKVHRRKAGKLKIITSRTSDWCDEYAA